MVTRSTASVMSAEYTGHHGARKRRCLRPSGRLSLPSNVRQLGVRWRLLFFDPHDYGRMRIEADIYVVALFNGGEHVAIAPKNTLAETQVLGLHHKRIAAGPAALDESRFLLGRTSEVHRRLDRLEAEQHSEDAEDDHKHPRASVIRTGEHIEQIEERRPGASHKQRHPDDRRADKAVPCTPPPDLGLDLRVVLPIHGRLSTRPMSSGVSGV